MTSSPRQLVAYAVDMGFTHLEFLPVSEHPFTGSWGYQPIGLFAPTARFGDPDGFRRLVARLPRCGAAASSSTGCRRTFPTDPHGLARFDGTRLYEHEDPRLGFHQDWNTLIYNFGRREVANFLQVERGVLARAIRRRRAARRCRRLDALPRLFARSRANGSRTAIGGRENLEAIDFLRTTNRQVAERTPGRLTIAEESTALPGVSRPVDEGGLGFDFKWNMGWMHDTLDYMQKDPVWRKLPPQPDDVRHRLCLLRELRAAAQP